MHYNTLVFFLIAFLPTFSLAVPVPIEAQISPLNKKDVDLYTRQDFYEDDVGKRSVDVRARQNFYAGKRWVKVDTRHEDDAGKRSVDVKARQDFYENDAGK
jgi:hypothetical protein